MVLMVFSWQWRQKLGFVLSHPGAGPFCLRGWPARIFIWRMFHLKRNSMLTQHDSLAGQDRRGQVWFIEVGVVTAHSFAGSGCHIRFSGSDLILWHGNWLRSYLDRVIIFLVSSRYFWVSSTVPQTGVARCNAPNFYSPLYLYNVIYLPCG